MSSKTRNCPICKSTGHLRVGAVISPWIRELGIKTRTSSYSICKNCGTGFFSKRYSESEMSKIYQNYRGLRYLQIRTRWEPWYSENYNSNHDSQEWINARRNSLAHFLRSNKLESCGTIIDVGGDRGQYIPDIATKKIVFDISEKETLEDVVRISKFEDLPDADLIVYAHVLEHVEDPILEVNNLFRKSKRIYVEIPYGVPVINRHRKSRIRFICHLFKTVNHRIWQKTTAPATGRQVSAKKMLTQSEHLTFFSEDSMIELASLVGADLVMQKCFISTPDLNKGEVLQCLLTLK